MAVRLKVGESEQSAAVEQHCPHSCCSRLKVVRINKPFLNAFLHSRIANAPLRIEQHQVLAQVEDFGAEMKRPVDGVIQSEPVFQAVVECA